MRSLLGFLVLTIVTFSFSPVLPQDGQTLTLEECIKIAMQNNSDLKNAIYQLDRAGANVKGSYSFILPRVSASISSGRFVQGDRTLLMDVPVGFDPQTGAAIFEQREIIQPGSARNSHRASVTYSQTLFDFGRSWNSIKQAKTSYEAFTYNLTATKHRVYSTVKQRYLELLKALKLEQEFQQAVQRSREQLKRTQSMYEIGSVAQVDVYKAEVTLGNDKINLINQQTAVEIARGNLNVAMGRDPETPLNIVDIDVEIHPPDFTLQEAIAIAEQNNPELKRFEEDMQSAEYGIKIAKAAYYPTIGFAITYSRNSTEFNKVYGDLSKNWSVNLGASFDFNIFNGFSDMAEVSRQHVNYSIAKENWLNRRRTLQLEVKQAYLNLKSALDIAKINETNLRSAEEDLRLAQERYRVGAGTFLEVIDAQVALTRARVTLVRAKYDALIAQAQLDAAMGRVEVE